MSSSPLTPAGLLTPRKEFLRDQQNIRSSFALLALSGPNCVRLYSFAAQTVQSLRAVLEQYAPILSFREDASQNLCEFALERKPWANAKSVPSEKLLVDIIAVIYHCGYTYLSTIDYGREADDRLAMAFSKLDFTLPLMPSPSRSTTPLPPPSIAGRNESARSWLGEKIQPKRVPFAISFASMTVMRVVSPPLHLTPAILQAVRGSWPRGVVSEKSVGGNSYEFKLKGYGWFSQDTFATDSLRHILTLLSSLDSHSFSLLTSISLTNRSRVKDLWMFTGPAPEEATSSGSEHSLLEGSPLKRSLPASSNDLPLGTNLTHRRLATDPSPAIPHSPNMPYHPRAATESPQRPTFAQQSHVLRKAAPRAQVPVSVIQDSDLTEEQPIMRAHMPSTVPSELENMTGIGSGSPAVFYTTSPYDAEASPPAPIPITYNGPEEDLEDPDSSQAEFDRAQTPPLMDSHSPPTSPHGFSPSPPSSKPVTPVADLSPGAPPLLGVGTFRDSAFSSNSEISCEIPIKWTGPLKDDFKADLESPRTDPPRGKPNRLSSTPMFPGGWQPTPISEKAEDDARFPHPPIEEEKHESTTPIHEFDSRVEAPEIIQPDVELRKSEAALVGMIASTAAPTSSPVPPISTTSLRKDSTAAATPGTSGQGWVLVNVENPASNNNSQVPFPAPEPVKAESSSSRITDAAVVGSPLPTVPSTPHSNVQTPMNVPEASHAAKAIVIMDALETNDKKKKSRSASNPRDGDSSVKRFFSLHKKPSKADLDEEKIAPSSIARSNLRDRLRRIGTPEAPRREGKRRSID